jgi:hypothetical protein
MTSHADDTSNAPAARSAVGRRTIARGAAWSVPVVAVALAAPAEAHYSGGCLSGKLAWSTCTRRGQLNKPLVTAGGTGVTVMVTDSGDTSHSANGVVTDTTTGGLSPVMRFYDENAVTDTIQTITLTFSMPVQNVSFSLLDVDSEISGSGSTSRRYQDEIRIITPASWSGSKHSNVKGSGTDGDPYRALTTDSPVSGSSGSSNVDLSFVGPLTQISFSYAQDGKVFGDPYIGISDISFQYCS